jgi:hypothetical protein
MLERLGRVCGIKAALVPLVGETLRQAEPWLAPPALSWLRIPSKDRSDVTGGEVLMAAHDSISVITYIWPQDLGRYRIVGVVPEDLAYIVEQRRENDFFLSASALGPGRGAATRDPD